jgi:hypothetical protein
MNRHLPILALLVLSLTVPGYAQTLAEASRQARAEAQMSTGPRTRVITNEDIAEAAPAQEIDASEGAPARDAATRNGVAGATPSTAATEAQGLGTQPAPGKINKLYVDRIASLRGQINRAQLELGQLEVDRLEASSEFARTPPNFVRYEAQMYSFNDRIETQRGLIASLKAKLNDAREAARRAGVPHPVANAAESENAASGASARTDSAEEWEAQQLEMQRRTAEINQSYLDRIATLRAQITTAQQQLARLQGKPVEGATDFGRTGAAVPFWEMQVTAGDLSDKIESQRSLIASLKTQLEEAREAARHAGVPHATD